MDNHLKRKCARVPIEVRVEYRRINAFIADFTRNISSGGFFVKTEQPLAVGTECAFTLTVPKVVAPFTLRGLVRRVVLRGGDGSGEPGMGVELIFDDPAERDAMKRIVDSLMIEHLGETLYRKLVEAQKPD